MIHYCINKKKNCKPDGRNEDFNEETRLPDWTIVTEEQNDKQSNSTGSDRLFNIARAEHDRYKYINLRSNLDRIEGIITA